MLLFMWTVWYSFSLYVTAKELRKLPYMSTRYQQLSFRFFVLQATLVGAAFVFQYMAVLAEMFDNVRFAVCIHRGYAFHISLTEW